MRRSTPNLLAFLLLSAVLAACGDTSSEVQGASSADSLGVDLGGLGESHGTGATAGVYVDSVAPAIGPPAGGTYAIVRAVGLAEGTEVRFGDALAKVLRQVDPSRVVVQVPPGAAGPVDVRITLPGGATGVLAKGFTYVAPQVAAPQVTKVLPAKALTTGGTALLVEGLAFQATPLLFIGWQPVDATIIDATALGAMSPALAAGVVDVAVTNPDGQSALLASALQIADKAAGAQAPALVSATPVAGSVGGGTAVVLQGAGFDKGAVLLWGGKHVANFTIESANKATLTTPPHAAGTVDAVVINPDGQTAALSPAFAYMYDLPAVYSLEPNSGPVGGANTIAISGYGFESGMAVALGTKACDKVSVKDAGLATCVVPAGDGPGAVAVTVTNAKGLKGLLPKGYTYAPPGGKAEISAVLPASGPPVGGIPIVIKGKNLPADVEVWFGTAKADAIALPSAEVAAVTLPAGKPGPVDVSLQVKGEVLVTAKGAFTYDEPQPAVVAKISPATGPVAGGITVVLAGSNLPANPAVTFGGQKAQVVAAAATAIVLVLPAGTAGPVDVAVQGEGAGALVTVKGGFTYEAAEDPTVAAVVPASGPTAGGIVVVIQGKNLSPKSKVFFGSKPAPTTYMTGAEGVGVLLPPGDAGSIDVTVKTVGSPDAVLKSSFTYLAPAGTGGPKVALVAVTPASSPVSGGGWALLKGANLPVGAKVFFGAKESKEVLILAGDLATARIPAADAAGPVDVMLVDPTSQQSAKLAGAFAYYADKDAKGPPPKLETIKPGIGPSQGGTLALVEGKAFAEGALVFFGGRPASGVLRISDSQLTLTSPASPPGPASVMVVHLDGQWSELADAFVYTTGAKPTLLLGGALPGQGSAAGGTDVTLNGSGFAPGLLLFLDGVPHPLAVKTAKSASLVTPLHAPGVAQVALTSSEGWTALLPGGYLYILEPPFVASIQPGWSPPGGGVEVVVTGQGFHPKAKVQVGGVDALVLQAGPTALKVTTPAGKKGKADVTVTNPDGLFDTLEGGLDYTDVAPGKELALERVVPAFGPLQGGSLVVVHGNGFLPGAQVIVGGTLATVVTFIDGKRLQLVMPKGKIGAHDVEVVVPDLGSAKAKNAFFYFDPASIDPFPKIDAVEPGLGPVFGETIALVRVSPASADAKVYFGGVLAKVLGADGAANLVVETPAHAAGPVDVAVVMPDGKADVRVNAFSYYEPAKTAKGPSLNAIKPSGGSTAGGDAASLTGAGFQAGTLVFLGYRPMTSVAVLNGSSLSGLSPAHPNKLVDAAITRPDGFSAVLPGAWAYAAPSPQIDMVFPAAGPLAGNATVVVTGTGFVAGAGVQFGGFEAKKTTFVASTILIAVTPPMASVGAVDVVVLHPDAKTATAVEAYTYNDKKPGQNAPAPTVVTPPKGPYQGGSAVVLWGDHFQVGAQVLFGTKPAKVMLVTKNYATVLTPAGSIGPVDVTILNPDGQGATVGAGFQYISATAPAPKLFGITPASGPEKGGTAVLLTGEKLAPGGLGLVGWRPLTAWTVLNTAIATGTTQAMPAGKHAVAVTNGDGQSAILADAFASIGAPQIDSFTPTVGPVAGGTLLTVAGKHFAPGAEVWFGGKKAKDVNVLSAFVLKVVTPASEPGPTQMKIVNTDGQQAVAEQPYLFVSPPKVTEVFASKGPAAGGVPVLVHGENLLPGSVVRFGIVEAKKVEAVDTKTLLVWTPELSLGVKDVTVDSPTGESAVLKGAYTVVDAKDIGKTPAIELLQPATGPTVGGTWGRIAGADFLQGSRAVFGNRPALETQLLDPGQLRFVSPPAGATGVVDVLVLQPDGSWTSKAKAFDYTDLASLGVGPKLTGIEPNKGSVKGGTKVTLLGTGLDPGGLVWFGVLPASSVKSVTGGLEALTANQPPGLVAVRHTDDEGRTAVLPGAYTFVPPPKPTSVKPDQGPATGGTFVTISGIDFATDDAAQMKVLFCASFAQNLDCKSVPNGEISVKSATAILVAAPAHLAGLTDVVVVNPDGQAGVLAQAFLYLPPPKILAVQPDQGSTLGGTVVTLTGTGFQQFADVVVGTAKATEVIVESATKITFKTPPGAAGPAALTVSNPDKASHVLSGGFTYIAPPKIIAVFPTLGPETGGTVVTIQGEAFVMGVKGSKVEIGGKAVPEGDLNIKSAEIIQLKTPKGTGPAAIKVINPDGQFAVKSGAFVYIPVVAAPKITYTTPKFAPTAGGQQVSVYGQDFLEGMEVAFGSDAVGWTKGTGVSVLNNGTLAMATTPAMEPGLFSVKATNSDGQFGLLVDSFEFTTAQSLPGLAFSGISPNRGPLKGGYQVVVYGQGFLSGVKVFFGDVASANWVESAKVIRLGPTLLQVEAPTWPAAAKVDIRVVNPVVGGKIAEVVGKLAYTFGQAVVLSTRGHRLPPDVSQQDQESVVFDADGDGLNDVLVMRASANEGQRDDLFIQVKDENGKTGKFVDQSFLMPAMAGYPYGYRRDPIAMDVDKDGDIDVLFRNNPGWQHLFLYRNQGDGSFKVEEKGTFTAFNTTQRLIPGDLNCDGIADLLVVAHNQQKYILTGDGKGGYKATTGVLPAHIEPSMTAAIGDVDKDGDNDIIVVNDQAFQNRLYYNNCNNVAKGQPFSFQDATYGSGKNFPISGFNARDVELADLNGDGWLDVVLVNWGQSTRLYLNNGGSFINDNGQLFPQTEALVYSARVDIVDVDLDGDLDMFVLKYRADGLYWPALYLNNKANGGAGAFVDASPVNLPAFRGEDAVDMRVDDLNGDKLPDLYLTRTNHQDWLLLNNGYMEDKAMTDQNRVPKGALANNTIFGLPETTVDHTAGAAGDIDGDGDIDLVLTTNISGYGTTLRVWINDGSGAFFDESSRAPDVNCSAQGVKLVDLNGDKDLDMVVACHYQGPENESGGLRQLANDGKGKFKDLSVTNMPGAYVNEYWLDIDAADIDGDGDADVVAVGNNGYTTRTLINGGDPFNTGGAYFFTNNNLLFIQWTGVVMNSVLLDDLSGDGIADVYVGSNAQNVLFYNDGSGKMVNKSVSHLPSLNNDTRKVIATDVDLDGDTDLFCVANGAIRLNLSELDHKYSDITASHLPSGLGGNGYGGAIADLDFDGYPDIITANWAQQNVLMLNQGSGKFANFTSQMPPDADYSREIVIADFDKDGKPDVFVCNAGQNRVYWNETPKK